MLYQSSIGAIALAAALCATIAGVQAADDTKYPNWKGEWDAIVPRTPGQQLRFDPSKPYGRAQEAPLTEEYKKIHDESIADRTREIRRAEVTIRSARIGIGKHHALMDDAANFTGDIAAFRDNGLGHRWRGEQHYRGHPRNHGKSM